MNKKNLFVLSLLLFLSGCREQMPDNTSSSPSEVTTSSFASSPFVETDSSKENSSLDSSMENTVSSNSESDLTMTISANNATFEVVLTDNEAARQLKSMLPMTLEMSAMAHEKYYYFDESFPTETYSPGQIEIGDIMLYGSRCLVIFYESFSTSYTYTRLGKIENTAGLANALGSSSVTVTLA